MSRTERFADSPKHTLREIREKGRLAEQNTPDIANTLGNPGHHNGLFEAHKRLDGVMVTQDGTQYKDATNYWMTEAIDPSWLTSDSRLMATIGRLTIEAPTVSEFATPEYTGFLQMMHNFWPEASHIFCYNAGTLATDVAAKAMVAQIALEKGYKPEEMQIAVLPHAFHGRAGWGMELTESTAKTKDWQTPGRAVRISSPAIIYDDLGNIDEEQTKRAVTQAIHELESAFHTSGKVAGIMMEYPFQAEGGALIIPEAFLAGARQLCDIYRRFLTVDAVQMSGKGYPFPPGVLENADYVTFGKFFRVCGVMAKDPTKRGFSIDHMSIPGKYGATWAGRLADMVAAQAIVSVIDLNDFWVNGRQKARFFYNGLMDLATQGKGIVRPRIADAYVGFDFATKEARDRFIERARDDHHVLFLPAGDTAIRWSPRLDISLSEVSRLIDVISSVVS